MATLKAFFRGGLVLALCLGATPGRAEVPVSAAEVRAVFTYNFLSFVDWPPEFFTTREAPLVIGVCGDPEITDALNKVIVGEKVKGRPIRIMEVKEAADVGACHILYVAAGREEIMTAVRSGRKILTVGETDRFAAAGGIIRFVTERNRVKLQVNLAAAHAAALAISSQLLRIAEVTGRPE